MCLTLAIGGCPFGFPLKQHQQRGSLKRRQPWRVQVPHIHGVGFNPRGCVLTYIYEVPNKILWRHAKNPTPPSNKSRPETGSHHVLRHSASKAPAPRGASAARGPRRLPRAWRRGTPPPPCRSLATRAAEIKRSARKSVWMVWVKNWGSPNMERQMEPRTTCGFLVV